MRRGPRALVLASLAVLLLPPGALAQSHSSAQRAEPASEPAVVVSPLQAERDRLAVAIAANDKAKVADWIRSGRALDFNFNDELPRTGEFAAGLAGHSPSRPRLVGGFTAVRAARAAGHAEVARLLAEAGGGQ